MITPNKLATAYMIAFGIVSMGSALWSMGRAIVCFHYFLTGTHAERIAHHARMQPRHMAVTSITGIASVICAYLATH